MYLDHSPNGSFKVVSLWFWGIEDLNWVCAPRNTLGEGGGGGRRRRKRRRRRRRRRSGSVGKDIYVVFKRPRFGS